MIEKRFTATGAKNPLSDVVARALAATGGWSVPAMREPGFRALEAVMYEQGFRAAAGPLPERAQVVVDNTVLQVGTDRLTFVADILARGLTFPLSDPLSVTQLEWNAVNRAGYAQRVMTPSARGENQIPGILSHRLPIYLTVDDFFLDIRSLRMSQRIGMPLDTTGVANATRNVNEAIEDAAINGATTLDGQELVVAGYNAPGLLNAPNANTFPLAAADWDATPDGANIFADIQAMLALLRGDKKFGPYVMYVNSTVGPYLDGDYDTTSPSQGLTIRERLLKMEGLEAIRTADLMPADKVAIIQMTSDVVDIVTGQQPTVIPWTSLDGFTIFNLVMAIMIPRFRSDHDGNSGVVIGTIE